MTTTTNSLGDTPPTVCPVCTGPCTFPGEGPTGQLGGLCTVCGWDYLADADRAPDDALSTTEATAADREARIVAGVTNLRLVLGRAAHVQGVELAALDDALGETGAGLRILSGRKVPTITELAALADELGTVPSALIRQAEDAGAVDWRTVPEGGQVVEAWHALAEDGPGVLLSQWLDTDPEGLPSLVGVQPVTNGSGRHIGTRYVLTVEAAQGLRDALAASEGVTA